MKYDIVLGIEEIQKIHVFNEQELTIQVWTLSLICKNGWADQRKVYRRKVPRKTKRQTVVKMSNVKEISGCTKNKV